MEVDHLNRVAIVTGASRGIGATIARVLAEEQINIVVNYFSGSRSDKKDSRKVIKDICDAGGEAIGVGADVSKRGEVTHLIEETLDAYGHIDILVNNAGISLHKLMVDTSENEWDQVFDVNLKGCFHCTQLVAQEFIHRGRGGRIINISSIVASRPILERSAYCSSKSAIETFTRCCALELGSYGITVNAIAPGPTRTSINPSFLDPDFVSSIERFIPLGKIAEPVDVAAVVRFLASSDAKHINGTVIHVDGGEFAGKFNPIS